MHRLVDEAPANADDARLADLVRSVPKFQSHPFRKRWVLSQIRQGKPRGARRFRGWVVAAACVFAVGSAFASGALIRESRPARLTAPARDFALALGPAIARAQPTDYEGSLTAPSASGDVASLADQAAVVELPSAAPRSTSRERLPITEGTKSAGEDPAAVLLAIRALRKEHDADRAELLLRDYLRAHPRGALTEEAQALQIEAATMRRDPIAKERATRYLRQYPTGRFAAIAEKALGPRTN